MTQLLFPEPHKPHYRLIAVALLLLAANSAMARPWYVEPRLDLSTGYDDNPGLESEAALEADIDTERLVSDGGPFAFIGGDIRLGSETETDLIAFDFAALARRYNNAPELDSEYLRAAALYQNRGQKNDFDIEGGYVRDSTLETELRDTGRFDQNVDRSELFIRPMLTRRFSPLWVGEFELGYRDVSYDERVNVDGSSAFVDFEDYDGFAQLNRVISERFRVFGVADFLNYRPTETVGLTDVERDDFIGAQLGFDYNISEQFSVTLSAGRGFTETDLVGVEETIEFRKPIYNAELAYIGERNTLSIDFARRYESTGGGSLALTQTFSLGYSRLNTFGGTLSIPITYINRDPERAEEVGLDAETRDYYEIAPALSWDISPSFSVSMEIRYRDQELGGTRSDLVRHVNSTAAIFGARYDFGRKRISY